MNAAGVRDTAALARDMIDVHGKQAADVARDNAKSAAVSGRMVEARSWLAVLAAIQRGPVPETSQAAGAPEAA